MIFWKCVICSTILQFQKFGRLNFWMIQVYLKMLKIPIFYWNVHNILYCSTLSPFTILMNETFFFFISRFLWQRCSERVVSCTETENCNVSHRITTFYFRSSGLNNAERCSWIAGWPLEVCCRLQHYISIPECPCR